MAVAKDGFLLQIKEAPRYVSGATVTTSECRIESVMAMCYLQETTTMVTLNAGLWMDHNPPLLYRYEYVIVTSSGQVCFFFIYIFFFSFGSFIINFFK